jgi:hypothetical protein
LKENAMTNAWVVRAALEQAGEELRLEMVATREINGRTEYTADIVAVDHPAEARAECARFARTLGVETYSLEDRRAAAA